MIGANGEGRTPIPLREPDPKSGWTGDGERLHVQFQSLAAAQDQSCAANVPSHGYKAGYNRRAFRWRDTRDHDLLHRQQSPIRYPACPENRDLLQVARTPTAHFFVVDRAPARLSNRSLLARNARCLQPRLAFNYARRRRHPVAQALPRPLAGEAMRVAASHSPLRRLPAVLVLPAPVSARRTGAGCRAERRATSGAWRRQTLPAWGLPAANRHPGTRREHGRLGAQNCQ